jgi:hypothetical protein
MYKQYRHKISIFSSFLFLLLITSTVFADPHYERCATHEPTRKENVGISARLALGEITDLSLNKVSTAQTRIDIDVYIHVIGYSNDSTPVTNEQIDAQMSVLNQAFNKRGFNFNLISVDYVSGFDSVSQGSRLESDLKSGLRLGSASSLNIYMANLGENLLGWATFPWKYDSNPSDDGVMILDRTLPGGSASPYNRGATGVHEVGHWLGLYHPWGITSNGCKGQGDAVKDTSAQKQPVYKCNPKLDSCRNASGRDPVRNFMNYTADSCMNSFSRGQASRMKSAWYGYRNGY